MQTKTTYRIPVIATLVALSVFVITCALGVWQWQRAGEKQLRLQQIAERQHSQPLDYSTVSQHPGEYEDFPVSVSGEYDRKFWFLIDNRTHEGQPGYQAVYLLHADAGNVLVNQGWVAAPALRSQLPDVTPPAGVQTVTGMLAIPVKNWFVAETQQTLQAGANRIQQLDPALMSQWMGLSVLPAVVLAQGKSEFIRNWQPVVMPPQKHIAYAMQWFALAIASVVVFFLAWRKGVRANAT